MPAASPPSVVTPTASSPTAATPEAVSPEELLALSDMTFRYEEKETLLYVSHRASSRLTRRERVHLCIDFIDKDGFFVVRGMTFDQFSLRPGVSEDVVNDADRLPPEVWNASEVLRFYLKQEGCSWFAEGPRSNVLVLAKSGLPPPPGTPVEGKVSQVEDSSATDVPEHWFRLEGVRVSSHSEGKVRVDYQLTNLTEGRATGALCVRLVKDASCSCSSLDHAETEAFSLGHKASERRSALLEIGDDVKGAEGRHLVVYTARHGCFQPPEKATSNLIVLARPEAIPAPGPTQEELRKGE